MDNKNNSTESLNLGPSQSSTDNVDQSNILNEASAASANILQPDLNKPSSGLISGGVSAPSQYQQSNSKIFYSSNEDTKKPIKLSVDKNELSLLKLLGLTFLLALFIKIFHLVLALIAAILVFGGSNSLLLLVLIIAPNILAVSFISRFFLSISKKESYIYSSIMSVLNAFGFLTIRIGYNYSDILSGKNNLLGSLLSNLLSLILTWSCFIVLFLVIKSFNTNRTKALIFVGSIVLGLSVVVAYNNYTVNKSFKDYRNNQIEKFKK